MANAGGVVSLHENQGDRKREKHMLNNKTLVQCVQASLRSIGKDSSEASAIRLIKRFKDTKECMNCHQRFPEEDRYHGKTGGDFCSKTCHRAFWTVE